MTLYLKMCSLSKGVCLHSCLECKSQLNPVGCKYFREHFGRTIVYIRIADVLEDLILDTYF